MISYYYEMYEQSLQSENNGPSSNNNPRGRSQGRGYMNGPPSHHGQDLEELTRGFNRTMNMGPGPGNPAPLNPNAAEFVPGGSNNSHP